MLPNLSGLSLRCVHGGQRPVAPIDGTLEDAMTGAECGLCFEPLNADSPTYPWTGPGYWLRQACTNDPGHFYHAGCLKRHVTLNRYAVCPLCREPLLPSVENLADVPPQPPRRVRQRTDSLDSNDDDAPPSSNDDDAPPSNNDDGSWVEQWRPIYGEEDATVMRFIDGVYEITVPLYMPLGDWEDEYPNVGTQLRETLDNLVGRMRPVADALEVASSDPSLPSTWAPVGSPEHRAWQDLLIEYDALERQLNAFLSTIVAPPRNLAEDEVGDFDRDALGNPTHPYWAVEEVKEAFETQWSVLLEVPRHYSGLAYVTNGGEATNIRWRERTEIRRLPPWPADSFDDDFDSDGNRIVAPQRLPAPFEVRRYPGDGQDDFDPTTRFAALIAHLNHQQYAMQLFNWDSKADQHIGELPWELLERTKRYILNRYLRGTLVVGDFEYVWNRLPMLYLADSGLYNFSVFPYNENRTELLMYLGELKAAMFPDSEPMQNPNGLAYELLQQNQPEATSPLPPQNAEWMPLPAPPADTDMGSGDTNDDTPVSSLPVEPTARFMALLAIHSRAHYLRAQAEAVALFNWDSMWNTHIGELPWELLERTKRYILNNYAAEALDAMDFEYVWRRVPPLPAAGGPDNIAYNVHRRELYELLFYLRQAIFPNNSYDLQDMNLDGYEFLADNLPSATSPLPPQNAVWQ